MPRPTQISTATRFAPALLAWWRCHGRHDLPWQHDRTPDRVWVSEIMLQQTQVATAIPYYERFMARFPDVAALASAPLDEVLHHWSGLGYYARARNLHAAARAIVREHAGRVPAAFDALHALPGIGRSTAGAILALSLGQRHPILDGNVRRVLARWFGVDGAPTAKPIADALWRLSEAVTPAGDAAAFTQAIMDLGATLCSRRQPRCDACPVAADCIALATERTDLLPTPKPGRMRPRRTVVWLVLRAGELVRLVQRPARGIWGGLWGFPEYAELDAARAAARAHGARTRGRRLAAVTHEFTHFTLVITPLVHDLGPGARDAAPMEDREETWYNSRRPAKLGLAAPVATLLASLATPD